MLAKLTQLKCQFSQAVALSLLLLIGLEAQGRQPRVEIRSAEISQIEDGGTFERSAPTEGLALDEPCVYRCLRTLPQALFVKGEPPEKVHSQAERRRYSGLSPPRHSH